jgi:hypothetical protein
MLVKDDTGAEILLANKNNTHFHWLNIKIYIKNTSYIGNCLPRLPSFFLPFVSLCDGSGVGLNVICYARQGKQKKVGMESQGVYGSIYASDN